ncbi:hypothetical protein RB653_005981 [Dictyostelium firmibasis]|uniref:Phosphatase 2A Regulatory Subunit A helical domain-containing protein n=1 Tax=Dictyostelium firmibasis TaxID=79012 RepID=A0AAN7UDN7_9MYCE
MSDFIGLSDADNYDNIEESNGNEYVIDDSLPLIEKIKKYVKSDLVLHRLYVIREFSDLIRIQFEQANEILIAFIEEAVTDNEPVIRQALVEQIPSVSECYIQYGGEDGYQKVLKNLLPIVAQLTTDRNPQVRMSAVESLQDMARIIKHQDIEVHLIPFIKSLVNDSTDEEHRVQAATLCHNLSPILGEELTKSIILPFIIKLSNDLSFRVRKSIALNLGSICQTVGVKDTTELLLPVFVQLSKDEMWAVRKGCAEVLIFISQNISPIERYSKLIPVFEEFVGDDSSRWVNNTAFQNLGPFIATFEGSQITPKLLNLYTNMINPSTIRFPDSDLVTHCAFNFPAVLYTVGSSRWPELKETYLTLVKDTNWKVRRTLSHSIHEIAKILGPAETKASLVQCFNLFLQDLDEVRVGVVRHFSGFLASLEPAQRESYILIIHSFVNDPSKWRFRKLISKQIGEMCDLFNLKTNLTQLTPILITLLNDSVAKVRSYAASSVGHLILKILNSEVNYSDSNSGNTDVNNNNSSSNSINNNGTNTAEAELTLEEINHLKNSTIESIQCLGTDISFSNRQVFTKICGYLVDQLDPVYFEQTFLPTLLKLVHDPVPNVRLVTAEILCKIHSNQYFANNQDVASAIQVLQNDQDNDVLYFSNLNNINNYNVNNSNVFNNDNDDDDNNNSENNNSDNNNNNENIEDKSNGVNSFNNTETTTTEE